MNEDRLNEVEAINSIYGDGTLVVTSEQDLYILHLRRQETSLRIHFPSDYPSTPPTILGTQSSGEHLRKGEAAHLLELFRNVLGRTFQPGEVCLFDVIEEANNAQPMTAAIPLEDVHDSSYLQSGPASKLAPVSRHDLKFDDSPQWTLSDIVIELKSVFVARCVAVSSPDQAKHYLQCLLDSDKKIRSATHNITAWRIKGDNDIKFQDCDDDGETAAGGRVLHLMQLMDLWNVMVVVTRWYGGHQLGPKRFSIINSVARDAFVKGDFVKDDLAKKKSKK